VKRRGWSGGSWRRKGGTRRSEAGGEGMSGCGLDEENVCLIQRKREQTVPNQTLTPFVIFIELIGHVQCT